MHFKENSCNFSFGRCGIQSSQDVLHRLSQCITIDWFDFVVVNCFVFAGAACLFR